jgi:hypothetical protein
MVEQTVVMLRQLLTWFASIEWVRRMNMFASSLVLWDCCPDVEVKDYCQQGRIGISQTKRSLHLHYWDLRIIRGVEKRYPE